MTDDTVGVDPDDEMLLQVFADQGDRPEVARRVDHVVVVRNRAASAVAADVESRGFTVAGVHRRLLRSAVEFHRDDDLTRSSVVAFTGQARAVAAAHGGEYDGWSAPVVS